MAGLKRALALVLAGALCAGLSACKSKPAAVQRTVLAMDTVMTLTVYADQSEGEEALDAMAATLADMEEKCSATWEDSPVSVLNREGGIVIPAYPRLYDLVEQSLTLGARTGGALDITAYPAVQAWGFTTGEYRVPDQAELEELKGRIGQEGVITDPNACMILLPEEAQIDLGAVAKGYTGDILADGLKERGITSALLDLGQSSIMTVGTKPDGNPWRIGIQDPRGEEYLGVLELADMAMGTSGDYQRYFEQDGVRYSHIIDPATAAPARSGLTSVTVVSPSCLTCDGLSTALFVMGLEKGVKFWRDHPELEFDVIFIEETGEIFITPGLEGSFTLAEGYEDREVTVLS